MTITEEELKKALKADFTNLFQTGFAADWENKRIAIETYVDIMTLNNLKKLVCKE